MDSLVVDAISPTEFTVCDERLYSLKENVGVSEAIAEQPSSSSREIIREVNSEILLQGNINTLNSLTHITKITEKPKIAPSELKDIVGLEFNGIIEHSFKIHNSNSKGELVGEAYFSSKDLGERTRTVAWYWSPETGFEVITSSLDIFKRYYHYPDVVLTLHPLLINEYGVVAASFYIHNLRPAVTTVANSWFHWTKQEGCNFHCYRQALYGETISDIDDNGNVLAYSGSSVYIFNVKEDRFKTGIRTPEREDVLRVFSSFANSNTILKNICKLASGHGLLRTEWGFKRNGCNYLSDVKFGKDSSVTGYLRFEICRTSNNQNMSYQESVRKYRLEDKTCNIAKFYFESKNNSVKFYLKSASSRKPSIGDHTKFSWEGSYYPD